MKKTCEGCIRCKSVNGNKAICKRFDSSDGIARLSLIERPNTGCWQYKTPRPEVVAIERYIPAQFTERPRSRMTSMKKKMPSDFDQIAKDWVEGKITSKDAGRQCGCSSTTFTKNANDAGYRKYSRCKGK